MKHPPKTNRRTPFRAPASAAPAARGEAAPESVPPAPVRTRRGKPATGRANRGQVGRDGKQVITAKQVGPGLHQGNGGGGEQGKQQQPLDQNAQAFEFGRSHHEPHGGCHPAGEMA